MKNNKKNNKIVSIQNNLQQPEEIIWNMIQSNQLAKDMFIIKVKEGRPIYGCDIKKRNPLIKRFRNMAYAVIHEATGLSIKEIYHEDRVKKNRYMKDLLMFIMTDLAEYYQPAIIANYLNMPDTLENNEEEE